MLLFASPPNLCSLQGVTYFWDTPELPVSDDTGSAHECFRALLRFEKLYQFLPAGATVNQARLNLTFINWDSATYMLEVRSSKGQL
jgi:hypothetical protein